MRVITPRTRSSNAPTGSGGSAASAASAGEPQRWARPFVRAFLVAFVVAGLFNLDLWPLTGWRLFSGLRHAETMAVEATAVDAAGHGSRVRFGRISSAYRGLELVARSFGSLSGPERDAACRAWLQGARTAQPGVVALRIDEVRIRLLPRRGDRPAQPPQRTVVTTCTDSGALPPGALPP